MIDPLNINVDVQGVDTELPLLPDGEYTFQIVESVPKPNKDQTGYNWNLKLALVDPATAIDGRDIKPNFPVFHVVALQAKDGSNDPDGFKRMLGEVIDAIFVTNKDNRPAFNKDLWESAVGKTVRAHIYIDDYQGRKSNKIKRLKPAA